ncbi:unnamed protein product, partial [Ectocarpus sp. 4 AP-2014]
MLALLKAFFDTEQPAVAAGVKASRGMRNASRSRRNNHGNREKYEILRVLSVDLSVVLTEKQRGSRSIRVTSRRLRSPESLDGSSTAHSRVCRRRLVCTAARLVPYLNLMS